MRLGIIGANFGINGLKDIRSKIRGGVELLRTDNEDELIRHSQALLMTQLNTHIQLRIHPMTPILSTLPIPLATLEQHFPYSAILVRIRMDDQLTYCSDANLNYFLNLIFDLPIVRANEAKF